MSGSAIGRPAYRSANWLRIAPIAKNVRMRDRSGVKKLTRRELSTKYYFVLLCAITGDADGAVKRRQRLDASRSVAALGRHTNFPQHGN